MRYYVVCLILLAICSCGDARNSDSVHVCIKDGKHFAQVVRDNYYRVFHVENGKWFISIVHKKGDKYREIGGSEVESDGTYMAVYDVEFYPPVVSNLPPESPLLRLPGYALVMEKGNVTIQDCQVRINGLPTFMLKLSME